ncbi:MAG: GTP-binding protein [Pseudomonadota bacterium]
MTETQDDRVPVTLLTGFLGSGKTTLLNHLLRDPHAGRIAVIMNEFGDVGLDHDLIEEVTEDIVLMHAGCLCCSIRGDLAKTMVHLLSRKKRGELTFERVVIETTGIADPGPILNTMVTDRMIAPYFRADGVVTLADAATGPHTLDTQFEAVSQVAMADLIVLTKTDLVTADALERFEERLEGINGSARRVTAEHGRLPGGTLFGLSAMHRSATAEDVADWLGARNAEEDQAGGIPSGELRKSAPTSPPEIQTQPTTQHDHRIASATIEVAHPIPARVLDAWLDTLMARRGPDILRMKGIAHVEGMKWPVVFHGVQHIFTAPLPLKSWSGNNTTTRVVVIGRDLDVEDLKASLEPLRRRPEEVDVYAEGMMAHATEMPF